MSEQGRRCNTREQALSAPGKIYEHYKGGIYREVMRGVRHTERDEMGVVYEHLWPHEHKSFFRPQEMFDAFLPDGKPRFKLIKTY